MEKIKLPEALRNEQCVPRFFEQGDCSWLPEGMSDQDDVQHAHFTATTVNACGHRHETLEEAILCASEGTGTSGENEGEFATHAHIIFNVNEAGDELEQILVVTFNATHEL